MYEDKESKEMMRILSDNKKRVRGSKARIAVAKEKAQDILISIWMCVGFMVVVGLMTLMV